MNSLTVLPPGSTPASGQLTDATSSNGGGAGVSREDRLLVAVLSVVLVLWIFFLLLFARVLGAIATKVINKLRPSLNAHIGTMTISLLTGKLILHDVRLTGTDGSVAVDSLTVIFRWWRYYKPGRRFILPSKDCPDCPLTVHMEGFRGYWYNRTDVYNNLEKVFTGNQDSSVDVQVQAEGNQSNTGESPLDAWWREWLPAVHIHIVTAQLDIGNNHLPTSLSYRAETIIGLLTLEKPECELDKASYIAQCRSQGVTVMLLPSPGYEGDMEEAPRFGNDGFVVIKSGVVTFKYLQDDAGVWPLGTIGNGVQYSNPQWHLDVEFGAELTGSRRSRITETTTVTWGPWADRQRANLQRFFFPQSYQAMEVTPRPEEGKIRAHTAFNFNVYLRTPAVVEFVFANESPDTSSMYLEAGATSFLNMTYPWLVEPSGVTVTTDVTLVDVNVSTSLLYRPWIDTERLELKLAQKYPLEWNGVQDWKTTVALSNTAFVYLDAHLDLVSALIEDLGSKEAPDLLSFIPYKWTVGVKLDDFRMLWMCNQYNWLDCSPSKVAAADNASISLHGEEFLVDFEYPNLEFQAPVYNTEYRLRARNVMADLHLPRWHGARGCFVSLAQATHDQWLALIPDSVHRFHYTGEDMDTVKFSTPRLTLNRTLSAASAALAGPDEAKTSSPVQDEWFSCLWAPGASITFRYKSHSAVAFADGAYPALKAGALPTNPHWHSEPNNLQMELNVSPGYLRLFGSLLRHFIFLRENYFGGFQKFHRIPSASFARMATKTRLRQMQTDGAAVLDDEEEEALEPLRQLDINVSIVVDRLHAILPKHIAASTEVLPSIVMEGLTVSMVKDIKEGHLNVAIGPCHVNLRGPLQRPPPDENFSAGSLRLNGINICAEGLYDGIDKTFVEYGWLVHLALSPLIGQVTIPQLHQVFGFLQPFLLQMIAEEDQLKMPPPLEPSVPRLGSDLKTILPQNLTDRAEVLKYTMIRLIAPGIHVQVVEAGCQLLLQGGPFRLANCTLANAECTEGYSLQLLDFQLTQYVQENRLIGSGPDANQSSQFLDAGNIHLPEVSVDLRMKEPYPLVREQLDFLIKHDRSTHRLWFLWENQEFCGCCGNCQFSSAHLDDDGLVVEEDQEEWTNFTRAWLSPYGDEGAGEGGEFAEESLSGLSDTSSDSSSLRVVEQPGVYPRVLSVSSTSSSGQSDLGVTPVPTEHLSPCRPHHQVNEQAHELAEQHDGSTVVSKATEQHDGSITPVGGATPSTRHDSLHRFGSAPAGVTAADAARRRRLGSNLEDSASAAQLVAERMLMAGGGGGGSQPVLYQHSYSHVSTQSKASIATAGSEAFFSCEEFETNASTPSLKPSQLRRQMLRRLSRHSMGKSKEKSSSESSFVSALASLNSLSGQRSTPGEVSSDDVVGGESTCVDSKAIDAALLGEHSTTNPTPLEATRRDSRLSMHDDSAITMHYAACLDAVYGDNGTERAMSPTNELHDARRESFRRRPRKSYTSTPLHPTKLVQRTPVLTRSTCGSPTHSGTMPLTRPTGAPGVGQRLGHGRSVSLPGRGSASSASDGPATGEVETGTQHHPNVHASTIPEEAEVLSEQEPAANVEKVAREVRAAVAVPSGIDLLITPLVVAAMQRYSQVIPSFDSTTTLASTVDWIHDSTLAKHSEHAAHIASVSSSNESEVPKRTTLTVDLPTVSCRILQASTAVHGGTRSSQVSVICLVIEEAKLLARLSTPDLDKQLCKQAEPLVFPEPVQRKLPQDILASVDVKSVHMQLCSQDKHAAGLSPDASRVCFSLDSPFGQFSESGEVQSSILCEFGIERAHGAVLRQSCSASSHDSQSEATIHVSSSVGTFSPHRQQSVFANPAAMYSFNQDDRLPIIDGDGDHGVDVSSPLSPASTRPTSMASSQPLDTDMASSAEVYGSVGEVWVQLPSAPRPSAVVASGELPINVLSAANLVLDIWRDPITSIVARAVTLVAEAERIRSHAICGLLEELIIRNAAVDELTVLHIRKPFSRLCCTASDLLIVRALYHMPKHVLGRCVPHLSSEDGDSLELTDVKSGIVAQCVGWLAAREPHDTLSYRSSDATPLLVSHHRKPNTVRSRPKATKTDYLMAIPNIAHTKLVQLTADLRCMAETLGAQLPAEVRKYLTKNDPPQVPENHMAKFEISEISVHVCPWYNPGSVSLPDQVHKVISCQASSLNFWSEQELTTTELPVPVSGEEAVLFAKGEISGSSPQKMRKQLTLKRSIRVLASLGEVSIVPSQDLLDMAAFLAASKDQYISQSMSVAEPVWAQPVLAPLQSPAPSSAASPSRGNKASWQSVQYFITVFSRRMARQQMEWQALRVLQMGTALDESREGEGQDETDTRGRSNRLRSGKQSLGAASLNSLLDMDDSDDDDDLLADSDLSDDDGVASNLETALEFLLVPGQPRQQGDQPDSRPQHQPAAVGHGDGENPTETVRGEADGQSVDDNREAAESPGSDLTTTVAASPEPLSAESTVFTFVVNKLGLTWNIGRSVASVCVEPCHFVASSGEVHTIIPSSPGSADSSNVPSKPSKGNGLSCSASVPSVSLEIAAYSGNGFTPLLSATVSDVVYLMSMQKNRHHTHRFHCSALRLHAPRPFVTVARLLNHSSSEIVTAITSMQHWIRVGDHFALMSAGAGSHDTQHHQRQQQHHQQQQQHQQRHHHQHRQHHRQEVTAGSSGAIPTSAGGESSTRAGTGGGSGNVPGAGSTGDVGAGTKTDKLFAGDHVLTFVLAKLVMEVKFVHRASIAYEVQNIECNGIISDQEHSLFAQIQSHTIACHADVPQQPPSTIKLVLPSTVATAVRRLSERAPGPRVSVRRLAQLRQTLVINMDRFTHRLTTDAVYQLAVMQKSFSKEFEEAKRIWEEKSAELLAASVLETGKLAPPQMKQQLKEDPLLRARHRVVNILRFKWQGIQLTASTPSSASIVVRTGSVSGDLAQQGYGSGSHDRHYRGKINFSLTAKLGNALTTGLFFSEDSDDAAAERREDGFQTLAYFTTSVSLQNMLKGESSAHDRSGDKSSSLSTVLANLSSPRIWCSTKAIDPALRLWLNYQAALKVWQQQQQQHPQQQQQPKERKPAEDVELAPQDDAQSTSYLLQIQLRDLGICVPFALPTTPGQVKSPTSSFTPGGNHLLPGPSLLLHISEIAVSTSLAHSTASQGTFRLFSLQLLEFFDEKQIAWEPKGLPLVNGAHVPEGTCVVCSRSILADHDDKEETPAAEAQTTASVVNDKVSLCVNFHMAGIDAHADTDISPLLSGMLDALTAATADLDMVEDGSSSSNSGSNVAGAGSAGDSSNRVRTPQPSSPVRQLNLEPTSPGPDIFMTPVAQAAYTAPEFNLNVTEANLAELEEALRVHGHALGEANLMGSKADQEQQTQLCRDLEAAIFHRKKLIRNRRGGSRPSIAMSKDWSILLTPATGGTAGTTTTDGKEDTGDSTAAKRRSFARRSSTGSFLESEISAGRASPLAMEWDNARPATPRRKSLRRSITGAMQPFRHLVNIANQPDTARQRRRSPSAFLPPLTLPGSPSSTADVALPALLVSQPSVEQPADVNGTRTGDGTHSSSVKFNLPTTNSRSSLSPDDIRSSPFDAVTPFDDDDYEDGAGQQQQFRPGEGDAEDTSSIGTARSWSFVDLDIAIAININSGQCCLYPEPLPKDNREAQHSKSRSGLRAGNMAGGPSASATASGQPKSRLRMANMSKGAADSTVLLIPGLHITAAYNTATYNADPTTGTIHLTHMATSPNRADMASLNLDKAHNAVVNQRRYGTLHVQLIVESLPEEMVIKPSFLAFLEKVLVKGNFATGVPAAKPAQGLSTISEKDDDEERGKNSPEADHRPPSPTSTVSGHSTTTGSSGSSSGVPIDVLLLVHVKPSYIRLSCMPWSSLECILKLPSVNVSLANLSPKLPLNMPSWMDRPSASVAGEFNSELGGVFLTGTLSRCSVLLALPYSAPYAGAGTSSTGLAGNVRRKESLFVELSSIKVSLSRQHFPSLPDRVGTFNVLVSGLAEIDMAELKYDTRNIGDIAAFIKAWSQTRLIEKLLLTPDDSSGVVLEPEKSQPDVTSKASSYDDGEVLVLIGGRLAHVLVHTNLAQVMAKTELSMRNVDCQSRVLLAGGSKMQHGSVSLTVTEALLDAHDGIVSGHVEVTRELSLHGVRGGDALLLQANLGMLEVNVEYMHQSVLMVQVARLVTEISSPRPEEVDSKLLWKEVDVILSGNTIPSMINISLRLSEFIEQQRKAIKRALGSLFPTQDSHHRSSLRAQTGTPATRRQSNHFHWYWLIRDAMKSDENATASPAAAHHGAAAAARYDGGDEDDSVVGQSRPKHMTAHVLLQGNQLLVAAFHGGNFRESKWAVFQWCQPLQIDFSASFMEKTSMEDLVTRELGSRGTHCITQALRVRLGSEMLRVGSRHGQESGLTVSATNPQQRCLLVQHVQRQRSHCPTQRDTVSDWIKYVKPCGSSVQEQDSHRLPQANVVLSLPAFVLTVDTDQWMDTSKHIQQLGKTQQDFIPQLAVFCQFDSTFKTPLLVATDVSLYIFLRKLVMGYIERAGTMTDQSSRGSGSAAPSSTRSQSETGEAPSPTREVDSHRTYSTTHWQLQPQLQLLSWAPGSVHFQNPPFEWLIEMLGFKHPRDTIPKWTQRTLMDPLDMLMAILSNNVDDIRKVSKK